MFGHYAKPVNFKSNFCPDMITYHTKVVSIQHNGLEIVYCPAVILRYVYINLIVRSAVLHVSATCMNVSGTCMNISAFEHCACILSMMLQHFVHIISLKMFLHFVT